MVSVLDQRVLREAKHPPWGALNSLLEEYSRRHPAWPGFCALASPFPPAVSGRQPVTRFVNSIGLKLVFRGNGNWSVVVRREGEMLGVDNARTCDGLWACDGVRACDGVCDWVSLRARACGRRVAVFAVRGDGGWARAAVSYAAGARSR